MRYTSGEVPIEHSIKNIGPRSEFTINIPHIGAAEVTHHSDAPDVANLVAFNVSEYGWAEGFGPELFKGVREILEEYEEPQLIEAVVDDPRLAECFGQCQAGSMSFFEVAEETDEYVRLSLGIAGVVDRLRQAQESTEQTTGAPPVRTVLIRAAL